MPAAESQIETLKRAYQILGVPLSASAPSIKQSFHRLAKRWHPDLYQSGTVAQAEATHMMELINDAYSAIARAPLRYHIESYPRAWEKRKQTTGARNAETGKMQRDTLPITDRLEFWMRFGCGALAGAFMSISLVLNMYDQPTVLAVSAAGLILAFGFGAAKYGDRFWSKILEYGWLWW